MFLEPEDEGEEGGLQGLLSDDALLVFKFKLHLMLPASNRCKHYPSVHLPSLPALLLLVGVLLLPRDGRPLGHYDQLLQQSRLWDAQRAQI